MPESAYQLTRRGYYADFFTVPACTSIAVLWMTSHSHWNPLVFFSSVLAGLGGWTLLEYVTHRWIFHTTHAREHAHHHHDPDAFLGISPLTTAIVGAFSFWFLTTVFGPLMGVGMLVGLVLGYLLYLYVHDRVHHGEVRRGTYLAALNRNHVYHHRRFKVNYGVVTPFWDMVFGTYQRNPATPTNEVE